MPIIQGNYNFSYITENGKYPNLLLSQILQKTFYSEIFKDFSQIPYDIACPSVKEEIERKICKNYGLYHASLNYGTNHLKACNKLTNEPEIKIHPKRSAAIRAKEC